MLRLSSLAICASVASPTRGASRSDLGARYLALLQGYGSPIAADEVDRALAYIRSRALVRTYAGSRRPTMAAVTELARDGRLRLELQDRSLMDPSIPSNAGRERGASALKTVDLCDELGLLRVPPGTLQAHGTVLCSVARGASVLPIDRNARENPFSPKPALLATAFFHVLRSDLPILMGLLRLFGHGGQKRAFSGDLSAEAHVLLAEVEDSTPRTAANRDEFRWLDRQRTYATRLARSLDAPGDKKSVRLQTMYRPLEDLLLPRLEFLVDVGALTKPRPADFVYALTTPGEKFRTDVSGRTWQIEEAYFSSIAYLFNTRFQEIPRHAIIPHLRTAYGELRNAAGYAPIEEVVLLANAMAFEEGLWHGVEIALAKTALAEAARSDPSVRIVSDRHRRPGAFRLKE